MFSPIEWHHGIVRMLDQTRLPHEVVWVDCPDHQTVAKGIRELWVRGAPAIGVAAAMGYALGAQAIRAGSHDDFVRQLKPIHDTLAATRPTAVNLFWALNRMNAVVLLHRDKPVDEIKNRLVQEAKAIHEEDIRRNVAMGRHGAALIHDGDTILTHCNTGALATGGHGTALGVVFSAWESGKRVKVLVDETRPVLQGARLTMWELQQNKIPATLITDNMAGSFMNKGAVRLCLVGADRIAANGDTANKIGTYSVAVLARAHRIPFYVAAPTSTIDFSIASGDAIPIEERNPDEVTNVFGKVRIAPANVEAANPAFDVTPAKYITGIITEEGIFKPGELKRKLGGAKRA
ncbi:MAG TPA: S-methyl-5-thioribose-1-phosphate isomerase [Nitrospiria bacterium]|nr:S-methyl-5-thioribose-1-phosphate isomerase [Nitrospiria bacterium]